jgi:guanylate kinase
MSHKLLGNLSKGLIFVMSAPAGTGKTTLVRLLTDEFSCVSGSISCTTRSPRKNEIPGKDYHFISVAEFEQKIEAGDFLEYAQVFNHYYGTSKEYVQKLQEMGKHVILVIDTQGAMQLKEKKFPATFIFVSPPSLEALRERLFTRQTEPLAVIEERLSWAKKEMGLSKSYDYHIVNDNLQVAYDALRSILVAEEHRTKFII